MRNKPLQTHAGTLELKLRPLEAQVIEIRA
jgi:hypothetical protein